MQRPLLSIIVPVYNSKQYLKQCINSILNQCFQDFELILINDGSVDGSDIICNEFASKDYRVKVIHKKNEGVSIARNTGIENSIGKYIMFADADDYCEPSWSKEMVNAIERNSHSLIVTGYNIHNYRNDKFEQKKVIFSESSYESHLKKHDFFDLYLKKLLNTPWNKIYSAKVIKENNIVFDPSISLGEDLIFNLEYIDKIEDFIVINKGLYNYILRELESLDNKYYKNLFQIYNRVLNELHKRIISNGIDTEDNISKFYNEYLFLLLRVLDNTFMKQSELNFSDKIRFNSKVMKSKEFQRSINNSNLSGYNKFFIYCIRKENYMFLYFYKKIISMRRSFIINKKT